MVLGLVVLALPALAGEARAGTYEVAQCGWGLGADLDPTLSPTLGTAYAFDASGCPVTAGSGVPAGLKLEATVGPAGATGLARARWVAPPGTRFVDARLAWLATVQPGIWVGLGVEAGLDYDLLAYSLKSVEPAVVDLPITGQAGAFEAFLQCLASVPGDECTHAAPSTMRVNRITFALEDTRPPTARLDGALLAPGWHRGKVPLALSASDLGAGVAGEAATIDGAPVLSEAPACATQLVEGETRGTRLQPCPSTASQSAEVDTAGLADGAHTVAGCATDFAGDQGCASEATVDVDNSPPAVAFAAGAEGEVTATASDRYSGVAAGTISMRDADAGGWTDLPTEVDRDGSGTATLTARLPGDLGAGDFVRVAATDVAGNSSSTQMPLPSGGGGEAKDTPAPGKVGKGGSGADGRPGAGGRSGPGPGAHLPAGRATRLSVHLVADRDRSGGSVLTVDFGTAVEVRGRLTGARGRGVEGRPVFVVVRGAAGTGGAPERRRLVTGRGGRFGLRLPAGTSRRVVVSFPGGGGLAAAPRRSLALRVRAAVTLAAEPVELETGESVRLRGRVQLGPARVSRRGKIVAIQYLERATGRWRPALVVHTDAEGRFDTSYRFRYVTGLARIRLRATAPAEGGWPFARGSSAPVTVTVHGR